MAGFRPNKGIRGLPKRPPILVLLSPSIRLPLASQAYRDPIFIGGGGSVTVDSPSLSRTFLLYPGLRQVVQINYTSGVMNQSPSNLRTVSNFGRRTQIVQIMLKPQEKVIAKPGSMCYMSGSIQTDSLFLPENERNIWHWLFGKNATSVVFLNQGANDGILPIDLAMFGGHLLCQPGAFLCSVNDVRVTNSTDQRVHNIVAGPEVILRQKIEGQGLAFIVAGGSVVQKNLDVGEVLIVDASCIVAMTATVNFQIKSTGPIRRMVFRGENLVQVELTGPGIVFLQSLPFYRFSQRIARAVTSPNMRENPKFFIQIAIFFVLAYVMIVSSLILTDI